MTNNKDLEATIARKWDSILHQSKSTINTMTTDPHEGIESPTGNMKFNIFTNTIQNDTGANIAVASNNTILVGYIEIKSFPNQRSSHRCHCDYMHMTWTTTMDVRTGHIYSGRNTIL